MIERDFGKFIGVCDCCGDALPPCDSWNECRETMRAERWKTTKNKETGEWENLCAECKQL